jgi:hypothetical protein
MHTLALNACMAPLTKTIMALRHLHPLAEVDLPRFVNDFHLEIDLVLGKKTFIFTLTHFPRLSSGGFFGYGV